MQRAVAEKGNWIGKYYYDDMSIHWPPNDGFVKVPETTTTLNEGDLIDRYGFETGGYLSPVNTSYDARALAPGTKELSPYHKYKILKPFNVYAGEIAPWFGKEGGGIQYWLGKDSVGNKISVQQLLDGKYIEEVFN